MVNIPNLKNATYLLDIGTQGEETVDIPAEEGFEP